MPTVAKGKKLKGIPSWKSHEIVNKGGEIIDEILPASCDTRGDVDVHESAAHEEACLCFSSNSAGDSLGEISSGEGTSGLQSSDRISIASVRKLQSSSSYQDDTEVAGEDVPHAKDTGYRFVHLDSIKQAFQESHNCENGQIMLVEDEDKRYGQSTVFMMECSNCHKKISLQTAKPSGEAWKPTDVPDINRRLVYAASEVGIGREGLSTFCNILDMPQPMSTKAWKDHINVLHAAHKTAIEKHFKSTRSKLRCNASKEQPNLIDITGREVEEKSHLDPVFLKLLQAIFCRLCEHSLLLRCLPGYSQNQNESLNSIVWAKAPKHKFKGPKAIEIVGMSAVLQFNCGEKARFEVMKEAGIPLGHHTIEGGSSKDKKRLYGAVRKASDIQKRIRVARRQANLVREMETVEREGGPSYESSAFNEDSVVPSETKKSRKA